MKKEALNQIQHLINISELMDQKGFRKESEKAMYDAFKIAESETYRIASEINNMTKTASRNVGQSKMDELEESLIATAAIGSSWLSRAGRGIVDWLKGRGIPKSLKDLGDKVRGKAVEKGDRSALQGLRKWTGNKIKGVGEDINAGGRFWRGRPKSVIQKELDETKALLASAGDDSLYRDRIAALEKELAEGGRKLSDLGKLTAGTAALGAAGIGGAAALGRKERPIGEERPLGAIDRGPSGTSGYGPSAPSLGPSGMKGFGPATSPSGASVMTAPPNIMDIEQRINNLERVVEAIRAKVGV